MKRLTGTVCAVLALAAIATPAANAHQGNPNYRSEITSIVPAGMAGGIELSVQNFDDNLELVNRSGRVVVIKGYDGEPYIRFDSDGMVEVNLNSPAHYLNQDRYADVKIPARADAAGAPDWKQVDDTGVYAWHDHRSHYMGEGVPPQVSDESVRTPIFDYRIPMTVDGKPARANGILTWVGTDDSVPVMPFVALGVIAVAGTAFIFVRRRRRDDDSAGTAPPS